MKRKKGQSPLPVSKRSITIHSLFLSRRLLSPTGATLLSLLLYSSLIFLPGAQNTDERGGGRGGEGGEGEEEKAEEEED